jgi:hypothetical protein
MLLERLGCEPVERAVRCVPLELPFPGLSVGLREQRPKFSQFSRRKLGDHLLDFIDAANG